MITSLHIRNVGIIEDVNIDFGKGFNVLTGETGAGKTLIIDSLQILVGGRFSKEFIRTGEDYSLVELCLNLNCEEQSIIISREVNLNGKNLCKINGKMVTVNELREYMKDIIDIHGQHDNQSILDNQMHIQYLDRFSGNNFLNLKNEYQNYYEKWKKLKIELQNNYGDEKEKQRKLDLLKYQLKEIEDAKLKIGEDITLEEQRKIILNAEMITENLSSANYQLSEIAMGAINIAKKNLEKIEGINQKYEKSSKQMQDIYYNIEELARDISNWQECNDFDEEQRKEIEIRLDLIFSLKRKYGNTIEEILEYANNIKQEIQNIENLDEINQNLKHEIEKKQKQMLEVAKKMHKKREEVSEILNEKITNELVDLEMKNAKFKVDIKWNDEEKYDKNGLDKVEFLIATNTGDIYKPLIKIASGGELSRIMLGIKNVLANVDEVPILVFDEIDTGISGVAANKVAEKLKLISKNHQVLCITHLASIAAKGDYNYYISKIVNNGQTKTKVEKLSEEDIIKEIARIASGNINNVSLEHAKLLRKGS